ncbi:MAG: NTPase [Candidatus Poribacteria bacterium]
MKKNKGTVKNILITGNPGVGKTTLIHRLISKLNVPVGGFYTSEIRDENGKRIGFKITSLDGNEGIMASVDFISKNKVSRYGVDVETIDKIGVNAIEASIKNNKIIVIDEIGKMELFSKRFQDITIQAFDSSLIVIGTISAKDNAFTKKIKERQDVKMVTLTRQNFNEIETYINRLLLKLELFSKEN